MNSSLYILFVSCFLITACRPRVGSYSESLKSDDSEITTSSGKIMAIGDVHGHFKKAKKALALAGAIRQSDVDSDTPPWTGGNLIVVQIGDLIDKGSHDREVLDLFLRLRKEAIANHGDVRWVLGNHEIKNVSGQYDDVDKDSLAEFAPFYNDQDDADLRQFPKKQRGRRIAFRPGGPYADKLAAGEVATIVGHTLFIHGGIEFEFAETGLDRLNSPVQSWMKGNGSAPHWLENESNPFMDRKFGDLSEDETDAEACHDLTQSFSKITSNSRESVTQMVIGHTPQQHINSACHKAVWRIDVGMGNRDDAPIEVLSIQDNQTRVLTEDHDAI